MGDDGCGASCQSTFAVQRNSVRLCQTNQPPRPSKPSFGMQRKRSMRSILVMATAFLVCAVGLLAQNAAPIATVNGDPITQADVDRVSRGESGAPLGRVLVDVVDERLLVQRGNALGYRVSDEQYAQILENLKVQNHITSDQQLDAALTQSHLTRAELRTNLERVVIAQRVQRADGLARLSVTDEDARRYYDAHLDEFSVQTFDQVKSELIERLKADKATQDTVLKPYLRSLRSEATIVWSRPDLQSAYEQAAR